MEVIKIEISINSKTFAMTVKGSLRKDNHNGKIPEEVEPMAIIVNDRAKAWLFLTNQEEIKALEEWVIRLKRIPKETLDALLLKSEKEDSFVHKPLIQIDNILIDGIDVIQE